VQENEAVANERGKRGLEIVYTDALGAVMEFVPALQISHGASNDEVPCTRSSIPRYIDVSLTLRWCCLAVPCRMQRGTWLASASRGVLQVKYVPRIAGKGKLVVLTNGNHLHGSPFEVHTRASC
jgi:hypothetical protein